MIDKHTDTWRATEQWLQARKEDCIKSLINGTPSDDKLRGEIRLIDDLLDDASEEPAPEITAGTEY